MPRAPMAMLASKELESRVQREARDRYEVAHHLRAYGKALQKAIILLQVMREARDQ